MRSRPSLAALCLAVCVVLASAVGLLVPSLGSAAVSSSSWNVFSDPIDPGQLMNLPFGYRSYWLQPWRSSLVTQPATALQDAIGINFDVMPAEASATAELLHDSGFRRARLEIGWDQMSYTDPSQIADPAKWTKYISAMRANGIRPLILLNANDMAPGPMLALNLTVKAPAAAGAKTVSLDAASAAAVVPGLTGFNEDGVAAQVLIKSISGGVATLSQPLPASLPTGPAAATTLRYEPFAPPYLADGVTPNPRFQQTLGGWLTYVKAVTQFVAGVYGSDNFDVEVWNELGFGSDFLNEANYFNPVPDPGSTGDVNYALLQATIQMLQNPAVGLTGVQVGDGFSDQVPYTSGATVPPGTAAIDKHPYAGSLTVSPSSPPPEDTQAVDAQGQPPTHDVAEFTPTFRAFFPEYYLTGIQTETLMRDLSPTETSFGGSLHGAPTHPAGSSPPAMWVTEDNLDATQATANGMPAADLPEFQAKAALRFFVSFASEGVKAIDLFASKGGACCQLIPQAFFNAVDANPSSYPANLGGLTMQAVGRMVSTLSGAQPIADPRQLTLNAIAQYGDDSQFLGNGTTEYPTLYNRDVLAFFPFQVSQNTFVAAVYVMTRDLTQYYTATPAAGQTPYDLPPEEYELAIGNVNAANASVSLYDPLTGTEQPVTIVSRDGSQIVVELAATDSPRMLTINEGPTITGVGPTPSSSTLTLSAPARISAATALRRGFKLVIGCAGGCSVRITATPARAGSSRAPAPIYRSFAAHPSDTTSARPTLKLNSRGRAWLRGRKATRLRVTARDSTGLVVSKVIQITHTSTRKGCLERGRRVTCPAARRSSSR